MTPIEIRQKLHRQIDQLPTDLLLLVDEFLEFLRFRRSKETDSPASSFNLEIGADEPVLTGSTGADLLPFVGTWQGDDFEDGLQAVYDTRSPTKF